MHTRSISRSNIPSFPHPRTNRFSNTVPPSKSNVQVSVPSPVFHRSLRNANVDEPSPQPGFAAEFRNEQYEQENPFDLDCYEMNEVEREELEFLARFIQGTAFYAETLEEYLGEPLEDFWEAREHAYHIITTYLLLNLDCRDAYDEE
jgi:hypothetical protein